MKIVIDPKRCKGSGECVKACPTKAIYMKNGKANVDYKKCDSDGLCIPACPNDAVSLEEC